MVLSGGHFGSICELFPVGNHLRCGQVGGPILGNILPEAKHGEKISSIFYILQTTVWLPVMFTVFSPELLGILK